MKARDCRRLWEFDGELNDDSIVECPECKAASKLHDWEESSVGCEDCGDHAAMKCPLCNELFDHVGGPTFRVLEKDN